MNCRVSAYVCGCLLSSGFFLAAGWMYWCEQQSSDTWIVEHPEKVVSGATAGEKLHVAFILRNNASHSLRILGVESC